VRVFVVNPDQGAVVDVFLGFQLFITANQAGAEPAETKDQRRGWFRNRLPITGNNAAQIIIIEGVLFLTCLYVGSFTTTKG
jgi:hypothetical protein